MRRVCGDYSEICARPCEFVDAFKQVIGHAAQVICVHEVESLPQVNANDHKFRIMPVAGALAKKCDYPLVIVKCAFRSKAADNPKRFHLLITSLLSIKLWRDTPRFLLFLWSTGSTKRSWIRTQNQTSETSARAGQRSGTCPSLWNREHGANVRRRSKESPPSVVRSKRLRGVI